MVGSSVGSIGEGEGVVVGLGVSVGMAVTLAVGTSIAAAGPGVSGAADRQPDRPIKQIQTLPKKTTAILLPKVPPFPIPPYGAARDQ
jgi:hypothetical protein